MGRRKTSSPHWTTTSAAPDGVACHKPARRATIDALVAQEGAPLPAQLPAFLRITDGLDIGTLKILGCRDLYMVDVENQRLWLVAVEDDAHFMMVPGESPVSSYRPTMPGRPA